MISSTTVRIAAFGALLLSALVMAGPAQAQQGWTVRSFDVALTVLDDGDVEVVETIVVDFGTLESRGIFREIPVEYVYEPDPDYHRVIGIDVDSVSRDGAAEQYQRTRTEGDVVLRIGDPDVFLEGEHTYVLRYRATGALNPQTEGDELFWNVTGNYWETTIESASATVSAPSIEQTTCFQGRTGSTENCAVTGFPEPVFMATRELPPGSGLTVVVALTKGSVDVPDLNLVLAKEDPVQEVKDFMGVKPLPIAAATFLGIVGVLGVGRYWWLTGRDKWYGDVHYLTGNTEVTTKPLFAKDSIVVEYMPPEIGKRHSRRLRPAEIGALIDERADTLDVTATLVDLAVRGYVRITELEKTWIFGSKDYRLEKLKEPDDALLTYEASLLRRLFDTGDTKEMSDLKNEFYKDLAKVKEVLYTQVVSEDKFFPKNPEKVRNLHLGVGIGIIVAGVLLVFLLGGLGAGLIGIPVILVGVLVLVFSGQMPRRTPAGREMYRRVLGFREYMEVAETDRQRFYEEANIFQEYLPYAIVFGCVDKWAKAFEDMGIEPDTTGWYVGTTPFRAMAFSSALGSFSSSMSSAIASTPGGSGGSGFSSGGGFSGGGVGGGGGGRW